MKKADIEVTLIDYMGDDLRVPFVAQQIHDYMKKIFPVCTAALVKGQA